MRNKIKKMIKQVTILMVLFFLCIAPAVEGQDGSSGYPEGGSRADVDQPTVSGAVSNQPGTKVEKLSEGKYFLDFKDSSLVNVLNVIASLSGISFVAGKEVSERKVNMTLDNVSLEDALQAIARGCNVNYDFIPGRNIYLFRAASDAPDKPTLITRVFKLYYVRVTKLKEISAETTSSSSSGDSSSSGSSGGGLVTLKAEESSGKELEGAAILKSVEKMLSERGKVTVDDRSNSLIVTDSEDRLRMIESAIVQLDTPLDQVLINVLLIETYEDLDRDLGISWGDTNGVFATISGSKQNTSWPIFNGSVADGGNSFWKTSFDMFKNTAKQLNPAHSSASTITTQGSRDFSSFQIKVTALESASKLKIVAKPKILVLDNHPALVKIATNAAIGTSTVVTGGGSGTSSTSIERAEVGTILRVTPLIDAGDHITMTVEPTFATVDDSSITVSTTGTGDPTVRTARTTLMVNDGQTIALGGLLLSQQTNGTRKVPFLGNLPLVGKALFTDSTKKIKDRELILFVTPYIIRNPAVLETLTMPDQRLRYEDETAPFWDVKQKEWYQRLKKGRETSIDFDQYFNVRKKLMDVTLDTLNKKMSPEKKTGV